MRTSGRFMGNKEQFVVYTVQRVADMHRIL